MYQPETLGRLETLFIERVAGGMARAGWEPERGPWGVGAPILAVYQRPVGGEFVGGANFVVVSMDVGTRRGSRITLQPELMVEVELSLRHPPTDRLLGGLGARSSSVVRCELREASASDAAAVIRRGKDVGPAADVLVEQVAGPGSGFLRALATPEAFLQFVAGTSARVTDPYRRAVIPALLASTGRGDEARRRILSERAATGVAAGRGGPNDQFLDRLLQWLDGDREIPEPSTPQAAAGRWAPPRFSPAALEPRETRSLSHALRQTAQRRAALRAVQQMKHATRDQRRKRLEQELEARSIPVSPLILERMLDLIERLGRPEGGLRGLTAAAGASATGPPPEQSVPTYLLPPPRAFFYRMPTEMDRWVLVELDAFAQPRLEQTITELRPCAAGWVSVPVWLE